MSQLKNKKVITALFALSCVGMLAGCSDIEVAPKFSDDAILFTGEGEAKEKVDVYKNLMSELYDAIAKGENDRVLQKFLEHTAKLEFGFSSYDELLALNNKTAEEKVAFANEHKKIYVREDDATLATNTGKTEDEIKAARVKEMYDDMMKRLNKQFYDEITSSSYSTDSEFSELKYAYAKYADFYDVAITRADNETPFFKGYLTALATPLTKEDVSGVISMEYYKDYINRKLLPEILKEKIVEEYIYTNYYSTLGRTYARNVETIKLSAPSDDVAYQTVPYAVMRAYVDLAVYKEVANITNLNLKNLENAWRGFKGLDKNGNIVPLDANEIAILKKAGLVEKEFTVGEHEDPDNPGAFIEDTIPYFSETKLGILLDKWQLVNNDEIDGNRYPDGEEGASGKYSSALSLFTGSNSYPKEVGFKKELAKVSEEEFRKEGWFVKNGGLSDYPSESIRGRLFNIITSRNLDTQATQSTYKVDKETTKPTEEYAANFDQTKKYVRNINDNYYLIPDKYERASFAYNMIIVDGTNYYMVIVNEAPSTARLSIEDGYSKMSEHKDDPLFTERMAFEIVRQLSNKDSYSNKAYAEYVEMYTLTYHDQGLLDYFKEQFPDLFE